LPHGVAADVAGGTSPIEKDQLLSGESMTLAVWCILIACLLPIVCAGVAKAGKFGVPRREGGYDNRDPRAWLAQQNGYRARANAAQANSFEALPLFIAAVLYAQQMKVAQGLIDGLAMAFIVARLGYIAMYLMDRQAARSAVWLMGLALCIALLSSPAWAAR
jgi:uncharacterized MAPEG superfamily protein